jgi:hypothetical protein
MRKAFASTLVVLMVVFLSAGMILAGNGKAAGNGQGAGDGTGPMHDICAGIPFTFIGMVESCDPGVGMVINTDDGDVTIHGIGPERYWESLGVERPTNGDIVTVDGYTVSLNGNEPVDRNIATKITIEGEDEVTLRDCDTDDGTPLWRGQRQFRSGMHSE